MSITELHKLPAIEKLKIIEELWSDLVNDEASLPNLSWHEIELKETEEKFQSDGIAKTGSENAEYGVTH
ncbi:MAG: hypothetical protein CVV06_05675 [Gammaproteobacteria bacterium HGW-Gammaproteobacteria-10]|nr:MAG: hypothetical protein CVV06_05675 [Gammaproteobacteria bacterium HGW-Gammaproteobacteria-10]